MTQEEQASLDNTGIAFALVVAAGLSTGIGALGVYIKSMVTLASQPVLAAGLGFSGGVMLYVSFVEIFVKAQEAFEADGREPENAYVCATVCLFAGMLLLRLIAFLVHKIDGGHSHCVCEEGQQQGPIKSNVMGASDVPPTSPTLRDAEPVINVDSVEASGEAGAAAAEAGAPDGAVTGVYDSTKDSKLQRMGVNTAAAIAIHNFPEGLATFVATLVDPAVGATLAIAIAIHNIPEGLCVALPIYYATGSRLKGFLWALFSGISEPIGAFVGWLIIKSTGDDMNQLVYGILFGVVAGMMIMIVLLELLPTGYRYDPQDKVVTNSLILGMVVMAMSLCLFLF
jgi:ZIP family zinc transporter